VIKVISHCQYLGKTFPRIDRKVMGAKWSRALALLLHKDKWGLLEGLVLEVLEERLWYNIT
jgi:hypothetical protein